jgi:hypothetical protein
MVHGQVVAPGAGWSIPAYAQSMLWVCSGDQAVQTRGPSGEFTLDASGADLALAWGTAAGPLLAGWPASDDATPVVLGWQGAVGIGGFIERLHALDVHDLEVVIAEIEGDLLPPDYARLPSLDGMRSAPFSRARGSGPDSGRQFTYTVIALADSVCAEYLHHALISELALDCFATLGPQAGRWADVVGLPLLVDGVSLLAPGYR